MSLTLPEVERIAELARLELNHDEAEIARQQLNGIFSLIEAMQAVNTAGITPMAHAQDVSQRLRADVVTHHDADGQQRDAFQSVAPKTEAGLYLVPRVIE
ncbi:glutamyl-tRNA(Gln) amidotransferase subunit C [Betaproteobacteria bacterium]|nr:glutamyl-tRNA(Gln) amidotransferase subunit C [Betaproteobacteria bacterium]GHU40950.1 glutamyl-tRNA(Gln) amidotransferase subunit C [Betaproteobacteria bacterium]